MLALIAHSLLRRPLRNGLTLAGIVGAMATLACIMAFGQGYRRMLARELDRSGMQLMIVPLGCPYDAAGRVLKNHTLENSLPEAALKTVRDDPAVAVAAPLLMAALPRSEDRRTDMWVGLDESALLLKPWWRTAAGQKWFGRGDEVILGMDAAALEMRAPGDKLYSPELKREFRVVGFLERSGTSDDSVFFVPLATAQEMFTQQGRLTAIAVRLKDPAEISAVAARLQNIPGAQVVTLTEMMGTFLNLLGAVRTLVMAVASVAIAVTALGVFNTLLASVLERTNEFAVMRAIGASRTQLFLLLVGESLLLTFIGTGLGGLVAAVFGGQIERIAKGWLPFAPSEVLLKMSAEVLLPCAVLALLVGTAAAFYPAWRAARLQPAVAAKPE